MLKTLNKKVKGRRKHLGVFLEYQFIVECTNNMIGASSNTLLLKEFKVAQIIFPPLH